MTYEVVDAAAVAAFRAGLLERGSSRSPAARWCSTPRKPPAPTTTSWAEEDHLSRALHIDRGAGLMCRGKARDWVVRQILTRNAAGRIRREVEVIGVNGKSLQISTDRILHQGRCYILDGDVSASVEGDGHVLESSRPTLTRMAGGTVLPGSALLVGLAVPKKTREDNRTANFILVHPRWRIVEPLDPDNAGSTRGIAAQINALVASQQRQASAPPRPAPLPPAAHPPR